MPNLLQDGSLVDDISLDKYSFVRDAFLQRRRAQVNDGTPAFDGRADESRDTGQTGAVPNPAGAAPK